ATSAGFVQNFVYGVSGLRINDEGRDQAYAPVLPPGWKSVTLKDVICRGKHYDITLGRGADGKTELARKELSQRVAPAPGHDEFADKPCPDDPETCPLALRSPDPAVARLLCARHPSRDGSGFFAHRDREEF